MEDRSKLSLPQLRELIDAELLLESRPQMREAMAGAILSQPVSMFCAWDYGSPGETYPCWQIAGDPEVSPVGVVHCDQGFGPKLPWGLIWLNETVPSMGQDSNWFPKLQDALAEAFNEPEWYSDPAFRSLSR